MNIQIRGLSKRFGGVPVVDRIDLDLASGSLVALLGPSGSGKTTLLRLLAGLERPAAGSVRFDGEDATAIDVRDRAVGFVFQNYALFPHLTVAENIAFGLRVRPRAVRPPEARIRARVRELLERVQLDWAGGRYPHQLSGGQRQRVALARALATDPKVLLLDEPFGALDAKVRKELRRWLRRLHEASGVTTVLVTHDQEEALEVADRVVVMNRGRVEQADTPEAVWDRPATPFVLRFLGEAHRFGDAQSPGAGGTGAAWARPHEIEVLDAPAPDSIGAVLEQAALVGPEARLALRALPSAAASSAWMLADPPASRGRGALADAPTEVVVPRARWIELRDRGGAAPGAVLHLRPSRLTVFADADDGAR